VSRFGVEDCDVEVSGLPEADFEALQVVEVYSIGRVPDLPEADFEALQVVAVYSIGRVPDLPEADFELFPEARSFTRRKLLPKGTLWPVSYVWHRPALQREVAEIVGVDVCRNAISFLLDSVDAPAQALHLLAHRTKNRVTLS
jgi:hypothetical protein